jgi:hypothetical protein
MGRRCFSLLVACAWLVVAPAAADTSRDEQPDAAGSPTEGLATGASTGVPAGAAVPRYEVHVSPTLDAQSGARDLADAVTGLGAAEEALFRRLIREEHAGKDGPARFGHTALRAVRTLVWDAPVAWWFGVALHEAFGHGGRGREFHASPGVHLGSPWQGRVSFATFEIEGRSDEALLYIYTGGTEANNLAASLLERRAVEGVRLRSLDLLFLASNRLVASDYVLRTTPNPRSKPDRFFREYGGGDVARYLGYLHELHGEGTGITPQGVDDEVSRQYRRLRRQAWWNLLDPGIWWALGSATRMAARGDDTPALPLPQRGGYRFLPILSSEWTPSGGQTSLEWVAAPLRPAAGPLPSRRGSPAWFSIVARRGHGPSGHFGSLGAAAEGLLPAGPFLIGGAAEIWRDPRHGLGAGTRLRARLTQGYFRGLYLELGVKSQGYWIAQPATAGLYGALGVLFVP